MIKHKNSKAKGEYTEAVILTKLLSLGYSVLIPFGNNQRYDMVIDDGKKLHRVQCKTAVYRNGAVTFSSCSTNGFTGEHIDYRGDVDLFLVYCPEINKVYKIGIDDAGKRATTIRVESPKSRAPRSTIKLASKYEI